MRGRAGGLTGLWTGAGEWVDVDEVLMQIDTDKVTIDVRAPEAGVVAEMFVAEDDTVVVGQAVACVKSSDVAPVAEPAAAVAAPAASSPAVPAAAAASHPAARKPSISFPARITLDGQRVSALPAVARASAVQAALGGAAAAGKAPEGWAPLPAAPAATFTPPPGFAAATPVRMGMSEEEIDAVDLGGSFP